MSSLLSLGAINKITGEYIYPIIANKKDKYICPDCNKDLILCQGKVRTHHFRHVVDNIKPCNHYTNPSETQIHKNAKILLKSLLERKVPIIFIRNCIECKKNEEYKILEINNYSTIHIEYRFIFNDELKIADVGYIEYDKIKYIFEIYNTHKTFNEDRPEPWFEIDARQLINIANNISDILHIPCIRTLKCSNCINILEKIVRTKLGQKYPIPEYDEYNRIKHLRINFDAQDDIDDNKHIIELFNDDLNKNIVLHTHKGNGHIFIISKLDYTKYDYWNYYVYNSCELDEFPYEQKIDITGKSTINIIIEMINICNK
jgi:hypothetical protein